MTFDGLLPLQTALTRINALSPMVRPQRMDRDTLSQQGSTAVLAEDVRASGAVPAFDNSAVDGYALHGHDLCAPQGLEIIGSIEAGDPPISLRPGCTIEVLTGAILPHETAAVVMREQVQTGEKVIDIPKQIPAGAHCRRAGEDFAVGALIAEAGTYLSSYHLAAMAACGVNEAHIVHPLRIGILSSGNELHPDSSPLPPAHIFDANRPGLRHLLASKPVTINDLGIIGDDADALQQRLDAARDCDVIIISAGMSSSQTDFTARMMRDHQCIFWQLAIKPARPTGLCKLDDGRYVLGLPGNAAACLQAAWLIGLPLISRLMGGVATLPQGYPVRLHGGLATRAGRREFPRACLHDVDGELYAEALPASSAGLRLSLQADGILDLPAERSDFARGDRVSFFPFPPALCYNALTTGSNGR